MADPGTLITVAAIFLLAGTVKGVIGVGLPTISVGLLAALLDLPTAMALLVAPSFVANVWQAGVGGNGRAALARIWPFLLLATATVWIGTFAFAVVDQALLAALLGLLLAVYAGTGLAGFRIAIADRHRTAAGVLLGALNGLLTGMTGSYVVPGVMYLQAIGLTRDALIQAMGMLFLVSTVGLAASLRWHGLMPAELGLLSVLAIVPALAGMAVGQQLRRCLSEAAFRRVFFIALLVLGAYIVAKSLLA